MCSSCTPISTPAHLVSPRTLSTMGYSPETFWRSKNDESRPRPNIPEDCMLQHLILSFTFSPGPRQPEFQHLILSAILQPISSFPHYPFSLLQIPNSLLNPGMGTQDSGPQTLTPSDPSPRAISAPSTHLPRILEIPLLSLCLERPFTFTPQCLISLASF